jgi:hypothetical protein
VSYAPSLIGLHHKTNIGDFSLGEAREVCRESHVYREKATFQNAGDQIGQWKRQRELVSARMTEAFVKDVLGLRSIGIIKIGIIESHLVFSVFQPV